MSESTKEIIDTEKEIIQYAKNPKIGIRTDELIAFCNGMEWNINPDGHTQKIRNEMIKIMTDYEDGAKKLLENGASELKRQIFVEKGSKDILKLALLDFDYDVAADDKRAGAVALHFLANELGDFLVVQGGKAGSKHLQMLQQLVALRAYRGLRDSSKSGTSSVSTPTE